MTTTSLAAPGPDDGDQAADHPTDRQAKASPGQGKEPGSGTRQGRETSEATSSRLVGTGSINGPKSSAVRACTHSGHSSRSGRVGGVADAD
ncbi:hypothetical protein [Kitasatospora sp. NPDC001132]